MNMTCLSWVTITIFRGISSSDLAHYVTPMLQDGCYKQVIIHICINDLLKGNSIKNTVLNMQKKIVDISRRCICCGAGKIYIFSLIHTTRVSYIMFNKANQNLTSTCEDLSSAWEIMIILVEVTYMVHSGKDVLADNSFTILKNKYLLDNCTHHLVLLTSVTLV